MPYYEVIVTASRTVCVKADNEKDAEDKAIDELNSDWNRCEAEAADEFDEADPKTQEFIEDYKQAGDYYEA